MKNHVITVIHGIRHYFIPFVHCIRSGSIIDSSTLFSLCQVTTERCTTDNNSSSWQRVKFHPWAKDPLQKALKTYDAQAACRGTELSLAHKPVTPSKLAHYVYCFWLCTLVIMGWFWRANPVLLTLLCKWPSWTYCTVTLCTYFLTCWGNREALIKTRVTWKIQKVERECRIRQSQNDHRVWK